MGKVTLIAAALLIGLIALGGCSSSSIGPNSVVPSSTSATTPTSSPTTAESELQGIGVQSSDAPSGYFVHLFDGGDQVAGQVTLDLCGATYPSESLRVARYQVGVAQSSQSSLLLSTEAVAYRDPVATTQAFSELRAAAASCPTGYVQGKVSGEPPVKTVFGPKPDAGWPSVDGVDRLAFDATISNQQGQSQESVGVYLRHGRVLLAIYISDPKNPVAIDGQTTLEGIVNVFAKRVASLPTAAVS